MLWLKITMTNYTQTIITISGGVSYDQLHIDKQYKDEIYVYNLNINEIDDLNNVIFRKIPMIPGKTTNLDKLNELNKIINKTTYTNTIINFECCSGIHDKNDSCRDYQNQQQKNMWVFITNCLKHGMTLLFSDFSLIKLIDIWNKFADKKVFGKIPIDFNKDTCGLINVVGQKNQLDYCPLYQLKHAGELSRKIGDYYYVEVETLANTIVYKLTDETEFEIINNENDHNEKKNTIEVFSYSYSLTNDTKDKSFDEIPKNLISPCHASINFTDFPGQILISQCHLSELTKINPDFEVVAKKYAQEKGISYDEALLMPAPLVAQYTQSAVTNAPPFKVTRYETV